MIDFVGTHLFLRIALWVAMETMHFQIAQTCIFFGQFLFSKYDSQIGKLESKAKWPEMENKGMENLCGL